MLAALFDRAIVLRDARDFDGALQLLRDLVAEAGPDRELYVHALLKLGHIAKKQERSADAEAHFRVAVELASRSELASLS